jgi:hypothetical protein
MSINGRLSRLESAMAVGEEQEVLTMVPTEWLKRDSNGRLVDLPPDASPAQERLFEQVAAMEESVPSCK